MKKVLILVICCLCLVGCQSKKNIEKRRNNGPKIKKNELSKKYTFCYLATWHNRLSWSFYYDKDYNILEDFILTSKTYNSLSEAIENENILKEKCKQVIDGIECSVLRSNLTVDNGFKNSKPNYDYNSKIKELEADNWVCEELYK